MLNRIEHLPQSIQPQVAQYLDYLKYERGYAQLTLKTYQANILHLCTFCVENDDLQWSKIDGNVLKQWLLSLRKAKLKPRSMQLKLSSVKGLFKYLLQKNNPSRPNRIINHTKNGQTITQKHGSG
ncbi:site-specific integrase [Psychrosphaera aquimarina]|uniref:Site-specific integrase n=1 Tax=Psychrosphaera aquimarina TaxID=2044854 RepID=A0ABU3QYL7_9GAMM|nr:site-specific integrase [Psychrosphaera aquimarina]MDU0112536.1 site-specific integrase [Psychrosphaera aquimarina]